jgi:hypothetical protein
MLFTDQIASTLRQYSENVKMTGRRVPETRHAAHGVTHAPRVKCVRSLRRGVRATRSDYSALIAVACSVTTRT